MYLVRIIKLKQGLDIVFCQEGTSQNSHDVVNTPVQIQLFGKNCNSTICDDCDISLYSNSIFRIPSKRLNTQMSIHPLEEGFHSSSIFIQKSNILSLKKEIIGIVSESSLQFWFVINPVHALYIMHRCFCNIKRDWYLGHNIKLGMNLIKTVYWILAKSKMERLFRMSGSNIRQFTKAIASIQLSEHEHEHLIPMSQIPALGSIVADHHDESLKVSFGKKIGNLTENILAAVHCTLLFGLSPKVVCSKVRQGFCYKTY